jgi:hypothetical protein
MLEILQQFYIQMKSEPHDFFLYPGDLSTYTLRCIRCGQHVTLAGSIGETLFHAPAARQGVLPKSSRQLFPVLKISLSENEN